MTCAQGLLRLLWGGPEIGVLRDCFGEDTYSINRYIQKRNNDLFKTHVLNMERPDISPAVYSLLRQSTTASVERSFSMLQKLLAKDRKFNIENEKQYLI